MDEIANKEKLDSLIDKIWSSKILPKLKEIVFDLAYDTSYSNGNREGLIVDIDGNMTRHTIGQGISETWYRAIKEGRAKTVAEIPYNWAEEIELDKDAQLEDIIDYRDVIIYE